MENLNLSEEVRLGIAGHSKGRGDLTAFDGEATSTLEAAVVRVSDRIAYLNHDLEDAVRSGIITSIPDRFQIAASHSKRIGAMVMDVIGNSLDQPAIRLSSPMLAVMNDLKEWLYENVYLRYPVIYPDTLKAQAVVRDLYAHYLQPGALPESFESAQGAVDYVAGMTDRFAIETFVTLRVPEAFRA